MLRLGHKSKGSIKKIDLTQKIYKTNEKNYIINKRKTRKKNHNFPFCACTEICKYHKFGPVPDKLPIGADILLPITTFRRKMSWSKLPDPDLNKLAEDQTNIRIRGTLNK